MTMPRLVLLAIALASCDDPSPYRPWQAAPADATLGPMELYQHAISSDCEAEKVERDMSPYVMREEAYVRISCDKLGKRSFSFDIILNEELFVTEINLDWAGSHERAILNLALVAAHLLTRQQHDIIRELAPRWELNPFRFQKPPGRAISSESIVVGDVVLNSDFSFPGKYHTVRLLPFSRNDIAEIVGEWTLDGPKPWPWPWN